MKVLSDWPVNVSHAVQILRVGETADILIGRCYLQISELLFSGPAYMFQFEFDSRHFLLGWTEPADLLRRPSRVQVSLMSFITSSASPQGERVVERQLALYQKI